MDVLIKGMEMPTSPVLFCIHPDGKVFADYEGNWREYKAVSVPPHGRLIDVDYADNYAYDELELANSYLTGWEAARAMQKIYQNAPTLIPAEE